MCILVCCEDSRDDNLCPDGKLLGGCGLAGRCVDCLSDGDCDPDYLCQPDGTCVLTASCYSDAGCSEGEACANYRCHPACRTHSDCPPGSLCDGRACVQEPCGEDGRCPDGWETIPGSMYCSAETCPGVMRGRCGLKGRCVECLVDGHCGPGKVCRLDGSCGAPECRTAEDCPDSMVCTSGGECARPCNDDSGCARGWRCNGEHCYRGRCTEQGECPEGWEPKPGSLVCFPEVECPEGMMPGRCGLLGECVQCLVDSDCEQEQICDENGACIEHCDSFQCPQFHMCSDNGLCRKICFSYADCPPGYLCDRHSACQRERCTPEGDCPAGWLEVDGSLACMLESCEAAGLMDGACGLEGSCVMCITTEDCQERWPGYECDLYGMCGHLGRECERDIDCGRISDLRIVCINGDCVIPCDTDMDCPYGIPCNVNCETERCTQDRQCPPGWSSIPGTLVCRWTPCDEEGLVLGGCGLSGQCVECLVDSQCEGGKICDLNGSCKSPECSIESDCQAGHDCVSGRCVAICELDLDCETGSVCDHGTGTCRQVRCDGHGPCDIWGWQPVADTLLCRHDPCPDSDLIPGVCALEHTCIECILDEDCPAGEYCRQHGRCQEFPECDPEEQTGCSNMDTCVEGRCFRSCETIFDCMTGICMPGGYCYHERCSREGECPEGWIPGNDVTTPGTLNCVRL
ncbi:MAG: hypothetical protein JXR96_01315 [Deltaproteobacteria bacterium]|nr:hypothetical protein [Deltaproteobacteria bacterium]